MGGHVISRGSSAARRHSSTADLTIGSRIGWEDRAERHEAQVIAKGVSTGQGVRVLVVEDNVDVAEFAVGALSELDYQVVLARSATEAMEELATNSERFDFVFSDVVMPGISGLELAKWIRDQHSGLPIILTSGYSELLAHDLEHGFTLLRKPYSIKDLVKALARATNKRH